MSRSAGVSKWNHERPRKLIVMFSDQGEHKLRSLPDDDETQQHGQVFRRAPSSRSPHCLESLLSHVFFHTITMAVVVLED